ncbi:Arm DNA-binding domain-containing protein [Peribacillus sp. NJ4]|nr:Arm DNA-binding domain-containing protein [Peribacillus sp. NJ4]MDM5214960.1 Arm DNA-binding domain-containing protein [Peribacillus sp. NJ4]
MVNVAKDPVTGKRRQITKSGFKTKKEAKQRNIYIVLTLYKERLCKTEENKPF